MDSAILHGPVAAAAIAAPVLFVICRSMVRRRRRRRILDAAKLEAREHLKAVTAAMVSKKLDQLKRVAGHVASIHDLAERHGFSLQDIRASRQRLEQWRCTAAEIVANNGQVPVRRILEGMMSRVPTIIAYNPDEPGTPGIAINDEQLALPATTPERDGGWTVPAPAAPIILPAPEEPAREINPIERMIEEVLQAVPDSGILPDRKVVETVTFGEDGTATSVVGLEREDDGIEIVLCEDDVDPALPEPPKEKTVSIDDHVERIFERMIEK